MSRSKHHGCGGPCGICRPHKHKGCHQDKAAVVRQTQDKVEDLDETQEDMYDVDEYICGNELECGCMCILYPHHAGACECNAGQP